MFLDVFGRFGTRKDILLCLVHFGGVLGVFWDVLGRFGMYWDVFSFFLGKFLDQNFPKFAKN